MTAQALDAAAKLAHDLRQPAELFQVRVAEAMVALEQGRNRDAHALLSEAFALGERAQPDMAIPAYGIQQFMLAELENRLAEVEHTVRSVVADFPARVAFRCALAYLLARLDRYEEASSLLTELARDDAALLPFDQEWLYGMCLLAETAVILDDSAAAAALYPLLEPWSKLVAVDHPEGSRGSVARYLGLLATTLERPDEAKNWLEAAITVNDGSRHGRGPLPLE